MIWDLLLGLGRLVDRLLGNVPARGSWAALDGDAGQVRIDGERAEDAWAARQGYVYVPPIHTELNLDLDAQPHEPIPLRFGSHEAAELAEADAEAQRQPEVLEPDRLAEKWCTYHGAWADPLGGAEVRSHAGPNAGCTWCCASCLARATVIGTILLEQS